MRERVLRSAMHPSRGCMTEIVPGGAVKMKASAPKSTNSICATSAEAAAEKDDDYVDDHKTMPDYEYQEDSSMASASESDFSVDSDSSEWDINDDVMEDDSECSNIRSFQSIAWMNVNSNGRTNEDGTHLMKEPNFEADNTETKRQTKQLNVGATPLEPVGLSLSSSGVQLYMMVNPDEKKKLLANAKVQLATVTRKKRVRKSTVNATRMENEKSSQVNTESRSWSNVNMDVTDYKNNASCRSESQRIEHPASRFGYGTADEAMQVETTNRLPLVQDNRKRTYNCNSQDKCTHSPHRSKLPVTDKLLCGEGRGVEALSLQAGPSWRFGNEEIDSRNFEDTQKVLRHQDEREDRRQLRKEYIYVEPKDNYFVRESRDFIMRHNDLHPDGCHRDKRVKHNNCQDCDSSVVGACQSHYRHVSSDDEDEDLPFHDDMCSKGTKTMKKRMMATQMSQGKHFLTGHRRMIHESNMAEGRVMNEHSHSHATSQIVGETTSSTTVFHTSRRSPSSLDTAKMAKFTEYTENMRKNMKQDYRNLSHLIKTFNEDVHERNNNQSSQSKSDFDQSEKAQKTENTKTRCSLM